MNMKMKKHLSCLFAGALAISQAALTAFVPASAAAAESAKPTAVIRDISAYEGHDLLALYADGSLKTFSPGSPSALKETINELAARDDVKVVQPNYTYASAAAVTNDTFTTMQWNLFNDGTFQMENIYNLPIIQSPFGNTMEGDPTAPAPLPGIDVNALTAWNLYNGKRDVIVAMVDTGIDYTHPDLDGRLWTNPGEIPENGIDDDGNGYIDDVYGWNFIKNSNKIYGGKSDSHGTHGAGSIAAVANNGYGIAGLAQGGRVKVMCAKALTGTSGYGTTETLVEAIRYAEANGASICNLSLGAYFPDPVLYQTIATSGMLFVIAAGNESTNTDITPCYPASYPLDNIISVANLNTDGTLHHSSNYGALSVDIAAPGTHILSTSAGGSYSFMTGTSMSAPMVSAAAAMVLSHYDGIPPVQARQILLATARPLPTLQGIALTSGMLDMGTALSLGF